MRQRFWKWLRSYAARHIEPEPIATITVTGTWSGNFDNTITGTTYLPKT